MSANLAGAGGIGPDYPASWGDWLVNAGRPLVMGVINVTPDSFSDGGRFSSTAAAVTQAGALVADGADLLDVGGESTRPGASPVSADEQIHRVVPLIEAIRRAGLTVPVFVDTRLADVALAALRAGASGVNDVSALRQDPHMISVIASRRVPIVLMHMLGTPADMQDNPTYDDVVADVRTFLQERIAFAAANGIPADRVAIDPGIGFGKTTHHNLELLRRIDVLATMGLPVLVGPSRKRFIGEILGIARPGDRDTGTLAAVAAAILGGAKIVRVHDVRAARQVADLCAAIRDGWTAP